MQHQLIAAHSLVKAAAASSNLMLEQFLCPNALSQLPCFTALTLPLFYLLLKNPNNPKNDIEPLFTFNEFYSHEGVSL